MSIARLAGAEGALAAQTGIEPPRKTPRRRRITAKPDTMEIPEPR